MDAQRTLKRSISCAGIGLHSGKKVNLSLKPAPANTGIRFRRTDLGGIEIPARATHVGAVAYATQLKSGEATVETVEHLLAALASARIDNAVIELNTREVPIMDGSSAPFVYLLQEAGVKVLAEPRRYLKVMRPISLSKRRQADRALPVGSVQGHLHDRVRPPAAAPPVARDHGDRAQLRGRDRAGAHLHVPQGSGDAAPEWPGAGRLARQRHRHRRHRRAQQLAAVRRRVRPPQDSGSRSATSRWSVIPSSRTPS